MKTNRAEQKQKLKVALSEVGSGKETICGNPEVFGCV